MSGEYCLIHFPWWMIHLGDVVTNVLCIQTLPDITQKEGSGGLWPVASQSHCVCGQYLTSCVTLWWSLIFHYECAVSCRCLTRYHLCSRQEQRSSQSIFLMLCRSWVESPFVVPNWSLSMHSRRCFLLQTLLATCTQCVLNEKKVSRYTPSIFGLQTRGSSEWAILIFRRVLARLLMTLVMISIAPNDTSYTRLSCYSVLANPVQIVWTTLRTQKRDNVETNPSPTNTRKQVCICDIFLRQIQVKKQISEQEWTQGAPKMRRYPPSTIYRYLDLASTQRIQTHNKHRLNTTTPSQTLDKAYHPPPPNTTATKTHTYIHFVDVVYPLPWPLFVGESDHPAFCPPASLSLHLGSSSITPVGSVHKSKCDNVVHMWVQLKRWCMSRV